MLKSFKSAAFLANVAGGLATALDARSVSQSDWNAFNGSIGGRLQAGVPFSQPCFPSNAGGPAIVTNASVCPEIQARNDDHCELYISPKSRVSDAGVQCSARSISGRTNLLTGNNVKQRTTSA